MDRNLFEEATLDNGLTLYQKITDTSYCVVEVSIPYGSAHNVGPIRPGTFHFLEHLCLNRSELFPERLAFHQFIGLKSVRFNAGTGYFNTSYYFSAPTQHLSQVLPGFIASIFNPIIKQEDVDLEKTIIRNERQRKERWFPGDSEIGHYLNTQWQHNMPLSLEQRLGSDEDLESMTVTDLQAAHHHYLSDQVNILYIGHQPSPQLTQLLTAIPTHPATNLDHHWNPIKWVKPEYHVASFRDMSRHTLYYGDFRHHQQPNLALRLQLSFLLTYLTNTVHGPLYQWLRHEKGWLYEIGWGADTNHMASEWWLRFPLGSMEQVDEVRQELWPRVEKALQDKERIDLEATRAIGAQAFAYQTTASLINSAAADLALYGRIIPESERIAILESCRDPEVLKATYQHYFDPQSMGSVCIIPEKPV